MEPDFDSYDGFLKGCNFMIVHAIIGFGLDFVPSTLVNILYTIIRILTNYFYSGQLLPEQYTFTIAVAIAYSYLIYKIEYLHRSAFLFKFKDDNWAYYKALCYSKVSQRDFTILINIFKQDLWIFHK
ncbi:unnamed protein product [Paramecium primaurelia]|uniref:Uncharacterized protein n=1 Tax=Paramecium primaurelia TaxID=5886 RepID=A0A8S1K9E1_PARPR|nr:unnamed protein product [Paramecium primaurelia]